MSGLGTLLGSQGIHGTRALVNKHSMQDKLKEKQDRLNKKMQEHYQAEAYSEYLSSVVGSGETLTELSGQAGEHGVYGQATDWDAQTQQEELGRLFREDQVYTDPQTGEKYMYEYDYAGTKHDSPGQETDNIETSFKKVAVPLNKYGTPDTRNAYLGQTSDPNVVKFGLARSDTKPGISPYEARYTDVDSGESNYLGSGGIYDRELGPKGVDISQDPYFDTEFLRDPITKYEYDRYRSKQALGARDVGLGPISDEEAALYGGGKTEYTRKDLDPLFGGSEYTGDIPEGTPLPKVPRGFTSDGTKISQEPSDGLNYAAILERDIADQEDEGGFVNAAKGLLYMAGEGVINTLDLVPEVAEYTYGNIVGDKNWSDTEGIYGKKEEKAFKEWTGYSDAILNELGKEAVTATKNAVENGDYWELVKVVGKGVATPELAFTSVGYVLGMALPGGMAKGVLTVTSNINKSAKAIKEAGKSISWADAYKKAEERAGQGYRAAKIMAGQAGYIGEAEQFGREAEELYAETYGEIMPEWQRVAVRPLGLLYGNMDAAIAKMLIMGKDPIAKAMPGLLKRIPEGARNNFIAKVGVAAGVPAARLVGAFGLESGTEGIQTAMEKVAGKYKAGEVGVSDVLDEEKYDIAGGMVLGGAGGTQMTTPSVAIDSVTSLGSGAKDKMSAGMEDSDDIRDDIQQEAFENVDHTGTIVEQVASSGNAQERKAVIDKFIIDKGGVESLSDDDMYIANEAIQTMKRMNAEEQYKSGDVLRSEPEEIYNAYINMASDEDAEAFMTKAMKDNPDALLEEKIEEARELRQARGEALTSLGETRTGVVSEGLTKDLLGFRKYFNMALNLKNELDPDGKTSAKGIEGIENLRGILFKKMNKLEHIRDESIQEMKTRIESLTKKYGVDETTMIKAMIQAENSILEWKDPETGKRKNNEELKEYYKSFMNVVRATQKANPGKDPDKVRKKVIADLQTKSVHDVKYASEEFNRIDERYNRGKGKFESNDFETLMDIADEKGIALNEVMPYRLGGSGITKTINMIDGEVNAMDKALKLIGKRKGIKLGSDLDGDSTGDSTNAWSDADVEIDETSTDFDFGEEADTSQQKVLPSLDQGPVNEYKLAKDGEAEPKMKTEESQQRKQEPSEADIEDVSGAAAGPTKNKYIDDFLNADIEDASYSELIALQSKKVGTSRNMKDRNKINELIADKKDDIASAINSMKEKKKKKESERISKIDEKISELKEARRKAQDTIDSTRKDVEGITAVRQEIWETAQEKKPVKALLEEENKAIEDIEKEIEQHVGEMNGILENTDPLLGLKSESSKDIQDVLKTIEKAIKTLKGSENVLMSALKAFKDAVFGLVSKIESKKAARKKYIDEIRDINDKISVLEYNASNVFGEDWKDIAQEAKETIEEKKQESKELSLEIRKLQEEKRGVAYTKDILKSSKKGTLGKEGKKKEIISTVYDTETGKPIVDTNAEGFVLDLENLLDVGKATSTLGSVEISKEDANYVLQGDMLKTIKESLIPGTLSDQKLATYPYLMLLVDNKGEVNKNVAAAMVMSLEKYILENKSQLSQLSARDAESLYGLNADAGEVPTPEMLDGGIPIKNVADTIGTSMMKMLGLSPKKIRDDDGNIIDSGEEIYEKIRLGIGSAAMILGENLGSEENRVLVNKKVSGEILDVSWLEMLGVVRLDAKEIMTSTVQFSDNYRNNENKITSKLAKRLVDKQNEYENKFAIDKADTEIKTEPRIRKPEDVKARRAELMDVPKEKAELIVEYEQTSWSPNKDVISYAKSLGSDTLRSLMGYKTLSDKKKKTMLKEAVDSIDGKNRQIDSDIESFEKLSEMIDNGEIDSEVYFDWFVTSYGRLMIDGKGGLNPQSKILHRFMLSIDKTDQTVDVKEDPLSETIFLLGVAQGFGYKVDKKDVEDSKGFAKRMLNNIGEIEEHIKNGKHKFNIGDNEVDIEEPSHAIQAITEGKKWNKSDNGKKPFKTVMTLEVDGITNGFAHRMMQYLATDSGGNEINESAKEWMSKMGVDFNNVEEMKDMASKIANGDVLDSYWTLGSEMDPEAIPADAKNRANKLLADASEEYQVIVKTELDRKFGSSNLDKIEKTAKITLAVLPSLTEEKDGKTVLAKTVRDLMKQPFMTFWYSAGFKSMSNAVATELINDVAQKIIDYKIGSENDPTREFLFNIGAKNAADVKQLQEDLINKQYSAIMIGEEGFKRSFKDIFYGRVHGVYGDAIQQIMEKNFGEVLEINKSITNATQVMFSIFNVKYQEELEKRGIDGAPTNQDRDEILKSYVMKPFLPLVKMINSKGWDDASLMLKTKRDIGATNKYGRIEGLAVKEGEGHENRKINSMRDSMDDIGVGAGVMMTHNSGDAAGVTTTMQRHKVNQVFDAYVLGVNQGMIPAEANEDFFNQTLGSDWSQTGAVLEGLNRLIDSADSLVDSGRLEAFYNSVAEEAGLIVKDDETSSEVVRGAMGALSGKHKEMQSRKNQMKESEEFTVEQFSFPNSAYVQSQIDIMANKHNLGSKQNNKLKKMRALFNEYIEECSNGM